MPNHTDLFTYGMPEARSFLAFWNGTNFDNEEMVLKRFIWIEACFQRHQTETLKLTQEEINEGQRIKQALLFYGLIQKPT